MVAQSIGVFTDSKPCLKRLSAMKSEAGTDDSGKSATAVAVDAKTSPEAGCENEENIGGHDCEAKIEADLSNRISLFRISNLSFVSFMDVA